MGRVGQVGRLGTTLSRRHAARCSAVTLRCCHTVTLSIAAASALAVVLAAAQQAPDGVLRGPQDAPSASRGGPKPDILRQRSPEAILSALTALISAPTLIRGVSFVGSNDGGLPAHSTTDGSILREFDTNRQFETLNRVRAGSGAIQGPGPTIAGGRLSLHSGYGDHLGRPGNVLLAFGVDSPRDARGASVEAADRPSARTDQNSLEAHRQLVEKRKQGIIDVYFVGDSITRRWGALDYPELLENWKANFFGWNAANFGWGGDKTQHILWRLQNGELDALHPRIIVVQAGTNNVGAQPGGSGKVAEIVRGVTAIVDLCKRHAATVIVMAIFPRNDNMAVLPEINRINASLARLDDGGRVRFLNVNDKLAGSDGRLFEGMMNASDALHPTVKGYQVWADALKPMFAERLGPPKAIDRAPAPTGDPRRTSAK